MTHDQAPLPNAEAHQASERASEQVSVLTIDTFGGIREPDAVPRKQRIQYTGAMYDLMSGGGQRQNIFRDNADLYPSGLAAVVDQV